MAFQISVENDKPTLTPVWRSRDMHVPDPPVVANGVVYAIQTGENTTQSVGGSGGGQAPGGRGGQPAPPASAPGAASGAAGRGPGSSDFAAAMIAGAKMRATPVTNLVLYAFDAETGKELYSSDKIISSWVHYSEPVVAGGRVYVTTWDGHVYCFGLK
jgi:outer membrane protein assembly factor BamB